MRRIAWAGRRWWPALILLTAGAGWPLAGPARAQSTFPPPAIIPSVVEPALPSGLPPIPPDEFGLSPTGETLAFFDGGHLTLVRTLDAEVIFEERFPFDLPTVGFSVDGDTAIIETTDSVGTLRVRFVDALHGTERARFTFPGPAELFVSPFGEGFTVVRRRSIGTEFLLINDAGELVFRALVDPLTSIGFGTDTVALVEPVLFGQAAVRLLQIDTGRTLVRQSARAPFSAGFNPAGDRFLVATTLVDFTRVRLFRTSDGAPLLFRGVRNLVQVGFTPVGEILVIVSRRFQNLVIDLFRTLDGRRLPRRTIS
ncbi:MAG: hypothetical protein HY320_01590 [Armatimonadetes bacterium]|nr:hypothetical protein [Armatimonadota bacterium]